MSGISKSHLCREPLALIQLSESSSGLREGRIVEPSSRASPGAVGELSNGQDKVLE
jgi:hypothetical protein